MPGLYVVLVAVLAPFLAIALERWVRAFWEKKREVRRLELTMAYFQKPASERHQSHAAHPEFAFEKADFTDARATLDGLSPRLPNGDLVVNDAMPYQQTERNVPDLLASITIAGPRSSGRA